MDLKNMKKVLDLQMLEYIQGGIDNDVACWSTTSENCGTVQADEWSTWSKGCR